MVTRPFASVVLSLPRSTGIEITAKRNALNWTSAFYKPKFTIDGATTKHDWGKPSTIATAPGQHQVQVHFSTIFVKKAGKAAITVDVRDGAVTRLSYKAPFWFSFLSGKIKSA